jgi:hypothetical protein
LLCLPMLNRTEMLLSTGGDDRLSLNMDAMKVNKYLSSTLPRGGNLIRRGSCTCSTISSDDYITADSFRVKCIQTMLLHGSSRMYDDMNQDIMNKLRGIIAQTGTALSNFRTVLFPSGSDAELLPLVIALIRHAKLFDKNMPGRPKSGSKGILNVVTAGGEVGRYIITLHG